ncbi:MAG: hypothetical protein AAF708_23010 [Deinococcota bacterium]
MNTPQMRVMCARCQAIFVPDAVSVEDNSAHNNTNNSTNDGDTPSFMTCPTCGYEGPTQQVMNVATFPSLEAFRHNWQASRASADDDNFDS